MGRNPLVVNSRLNPCQWSCHETFTVHADRHDTHDPAGAVPRARNLGADHHAGGCAAWRTAAVRHGGPGMAHNYVRHIAELADETGRTVIHYDQIGCGNSTHLPDAAADFWTPELFVDEFHTVRTALGIDEYHLLGQSWGGMLGAEIAVRQPEGLASLVICNSPASKAPWMAGCAA